MHPLGSQLFPDDLWPRFEALETRLDLALLGFEAEQISIRRHLHSLPEPSGEEVETTRFIAERLKQAGLEPQLCRNDVGKRVGVVADLTLGNPPPGSPLIAIRCDIDALRMPDEKKVEYASRIPNVAHACGHDAHTSVLLGIAHATSIVRDQLANGAVIGLRLRFLFQPAEETSMGAEWLVQQGAMAGVDAILGMHVDPERPVGQVGVRYGALTANCDELFITVEGHGGHAARPHHSTDPVAAAAHLVSTLYEFLPRSVDSRQASVITIGRIAGGYAANVIPEKVELEGTIRTIEPHSRQRLKERVAEICRGVEQTSGARVSLRFHSPLAGVVNHPRIAAALEQASRRVLGPENTKIIDLPSMGGEDFAVYLEHAPGALLRLGCAPPGTKAPFLHSPLFDIDERTLSVGTRILMRAALLLGLPQPESR